MRNPTQIRAREEKIEAERLALQTELADWYQVHKDDPDLWGDPIKGKARRRPVQRMFALRLDVETLTRMQELAEFYGCSTSDVARRLLAEAHKPAVKMSA